MLKHERFRSATMHTTLLDEWAAGDDPILQRPQPEAADWQLAALCFAGNAGWREISAAAFDLTLSCGDESRCLRLEYAGDRVKIGAGETAIDARLHSLDGGRLRYTLDGVTAHAIVHRDGDTLHLARDAAVFVFNEVSPLPTSAHRSDPRLARAAVAGTVAKLEVGAGDTVIAGQTLAIIEAMKMEMRVVANAAGTVVAVRARVGDQVEADAVLVELKIEET